MTSCGKSNYIIDTVGQHPREYFHNANDSSRFSFPDFCIMNVLDRKRRCTHPQFSGNPPADGCSSQPEPGVARQGFCQKLAPGSHLINKATTTRSEEDDLLFLTVQFSPCGKKRVVITAGKGLEFTRQGQMLSAGSFSGMPFTQLALLTFWGIG